MLLVRTIYYCNIAELLLGYNWNSWKNGNLLLTGMYSTGQIAGWKIRNYSRMESECLRETRPSTFQLEKTRLKSNKIWCISSFHHYVGLQTFWMPLTCTHIGVFQPFWCHGTLHKREGHSRNPMHWSVSPATYARLKLPIWNLKFGRICRQQYVIVLNQTRRAMRSSRPLSPRHQPKKLHVDILGKDTCF